MSTAKPQTPDWLKPTIRTRLTALYGGMFLAAGVLLILLMVSLTWHAINTPPRVTQQDLVNHLPADYWELSPRQQLDAFLNAVFTAEQEYRNRQVNALLRRSLLALVIFTFVAFAFGYLMAGRVLRPLHEITATARRVARGNLDERIALQGPDDELKELADTFDEMLDRLNQAMAGQRRFVANASHELRTPLAVNRTLLEVALADPEVSEDLKRLGKTLLATNERHEQMIEGLLMLARSETELAERRPVRLPEVVERAAHQVREEAEKNELTIRRKLDPAVALGDGVLLERLALNLLQNAVRHNEPGGWVEVTTLSEAGRSVLVVANTGPMIAGYEVEGLFEPFRRLQRTGRGVGLGLSIVRSIARAHGGEVTAEARLGGGLVVRVVLPAG